MSHPSCAALCTGLLISIVGCSTHWPSYMPISHGDFAPEVSLIREDRRKYEEDVSACQKEILRIYGNNYIANNAIIDMRQCLIKKGYVLLS